MRVMDVSRSRRSPNVIDLRDASPEAAMNPIQAAQFVAERQQVQRFRAKVLLTGFAIFLGYVFFVRR